MILDFDINVTLDLIKLKFYNEWLYVNHISDEGPSEVHKGLTSRIVSEIIDPLNLPKDSKILDLGCGYGYFLDEMKQRGFTDVTGVCLTPEDTQACTERGHTIKKYDISFLPQRDGYYDESVDFIFLRHVLEHSPYPIFTLMEYNRILKQHSKIYIETPAPETERNHETHLNHYSVLGQQQLKALLHRTGFDIERFEELNGQLKLDDGSVVQEKMYCIVAKKSRPLDVK